MNKNQVKAEAHRVMAAMEEWGLRVQRHDSVIVRPGSDLYQPPAIPGTHYCTEGLAWRSLATAGEHAGNGFRIITSSGGGVPTKPFLTGARTALVCGARALFVLEPDDAVTRAARTLQLLTKEFADIEAVVGEWEKAGGPVDAEMETNRKTAQANAVKCSQALVKLGKKAGSYKNDTAILAETSKHLAGGTKYDPRVNVMSMWHLSSGTAHGRMWAWDSGLEDESMETQLAYVWSNPLGLMNKAWELWNLRRGM